MVRNLVQRGVGGFCLLVGMMLLIGPALAACPADIPIIDHLTCSNVLTSSVDHTQPTRLGGECALGECYSCGAPHDEQEQEAPEAVYTFRCQASGNAYLTVTDMPCDLDIYVLDASCDPYDGCVAGSTAPDTDDSVSFQCTAGQTYYVVIEAYGTAHLPISSNPCTDTGDENGTVYSPSYTLQFDLSQSSGCNEDCDDGLDNDLDGLSDCQDPDCGIDEVCCDLDGDGVFGAQCPGGTDCNDDPAAEGAAIQPGAAELCDGLDNDCNEQIDDIDADGDGFIAESCGGDDCDDSKATVYPGAPEDGGLVEGYDNVDNDCDGDVDEGTENFDDDGDGYSETQGDCDDANPEIHPGAVEVPGNQIDDDCDGDDQPIAGDDNDAGDNGDAGAADSPGPVAPANLGCDCSLIAAGERSAVPAPLLLLAALGLFVRARRRTSL